MKELFRNIWLSPVLREFVLLIASSVAVLFSLQGLDLLSILDESTDPIKDLTVWLGSFLAAVLITVIKQTVVWLLTKAAKLIPVAGARDSTTGRFV